MLRFVPGMYVDKVMWIREGETKVVPETDGNIMLKIINLLLNTMIKIRKIKHLKQQLIELGWLQKTIKQMQFFINRVGPAIAGEKPDLEKVKEHKIRVNHH